MNNLLKTAISIILVAGAILLVANQMHKDKEEIALNNAIEQRVVGEAFLYVKDTVFVTTYLRSERKVRDHNGKWHSLIFFEKHRITKR